MDIKDFTRLVKLAKSCGVKLDHITKLEVIAQNDKLKPLFEDKPDYAKKITALADSLEIEPKELINLLVKSELSKKLESAATTLRTALISIIIFLIIPLVFTDFFMEYYSQTKNILDFLLGFLAAFCLFSVVQFFSALSEAKKAPERYATEEIFKIIKGEENTNNIDKTLFKIVLTTEIFKIVLIILGIIILSIVQH
ncbi:MAG: hypothetical protein ABFS56_25020 [Pseudomonadota bacterium]